MKQFWARGSLSCGLVIDRDFTSPLAYTWDCQNNHLMHNFSAFYQGAARKVPVLRHATDAAPTYL